MEGDAMDTNKYINQFGKYGPFVDRGHTNHLPMVQMAFSSLGCSDEALIALTEKYIQSNNLETVTDFSPSTSSFQAALGHKEAYGSYVTYFKNEMASKSSKRVVSESLNKLKEGIGAGLFHALIRLSFAVGADNKEEIIRSLAYLASAYQELGVKGRAIKNEVAKNEFTRFIREQDGYFILTGSIEDKEATLLDALCGMYISTGSFFVLHTITGFEALNTLKAYFDDYKEAIDIFTLSVLLWLERVSESDYKKLLFNQVTSFDELEKHICGITETHTIKLLYSAEVLYKRFSNEKIKQVAYVKFQLDHGL